MVGVQATQREAARIEPAEIHAAARRIGGLVNRTDILRCDRLSASIGVEIIAKMETQQVTGSFKARGVLNAMAMLGEQSPPPSGVATFSSGNHGKAVAYAAARAGLPCVVCVPSRTHPAKVQAISSLGAELVITDDYVRACREISLRRGLATIHPYDDRRVIAGHGTVGLEVIDGANRPDVIIVPVGGGSLLTGITIATKAVSPGTRIIGAEPHQANSLARALAAGEPVAFDRHPVSLADGLTAPSVSGYALDCAKSMVDDVVGVSEEAILQAWQLLSEQFPGVQIEPSAAAGLAALFDTKVHLRRDDVVMLVITGGNFGWPGEQKRVV